MSDEQHHPNPKLNEYWNRKVHELLYVKNEIGEPEQERHRIYLLLLMAIVDRYWNVFKRGRAGDYGEWIEHPNQLSPYEYKGHNIAALAVDRRGRILDFDFNHNKLFNSSAEHAESRLIRRVFALAHIAQVYDEIETEDPEDAEARTKGTADAEALRRLGEYDTLSEVTIYTSLESCAQCAGAMALGNVKAVVFLQSDPGMFRIGHILRNLSPAMPQAPIPIAAEEVGMDKYQQGLEERYVAFQAKVQQEPFWTPPKDDQKAKPDHDGAISSYLCTDLARDVYEQGATEFEAMTAEPDLWLKHADARGRDRKNNEVLNGLTNREVIDKAKRFYHYAITNGRRGTPHSA